NEFLGIRFGAPPVGNNRFRAPQPPGYLGVQNATVFPPLCYGMGQPVGTPGRSEDCLFLNVYAPSTVNATEKLPVWVWIQGGGYVDNSNGNYNASKLIASTDNKMIFVEFGYRVGPYGFMASKDIKRNGDLNPGLLDQRAVLLWVQKYISKFGGDPDRVVMVGPSAGAASIAMHLISYGGTGYPRGKRGKPLFRGAVGISPAYSRQPYVEDLEWQFDLYLSRTNCTAGRLKCLRNLDIGAFQAANVPMTLPGRNTSTLFAYTPCVDGDFLQDYAYRLLDSGKFMKVPVLFGDDTNEGSLFAANASSIEEVASFVKDQCPAFSDEQMSSILAKYPLESNPPVPLHNEFFSVASNILGEVLFICPGISLSTVYREAGVTSWNYRYDVVFPEYAAIGLGSWHTSEMRQFFEELPPLQPGLPPQVADAPAIAKPIQRYLTNFVRFLNPNGPSTGGGSGLDVPVVWPTFDQTLPRLLFQLDGISLETVPPAQVDRCTLWDSFASTLAQ
ncbi:hypothetical protein M408DRAFT_62010, partial [Serendipita vermifera MAFF 305830]